MRLDFYWHYATRSLRRGGQRTLLAIFCIAVGSLAIVSLQLAGNMVNAGILGDVRAINGGDLSVNTAFVPVRQTDLSYFDQLRQQGVITTFTAVATTDVEAQTRDGLHSSYGKVDAIDPAHFPLAGAPVFHTPGQGSLKEFVTGHQVVITLSLAQELHVTVGDTIHISTADNREADVVVKGIIENTDNGLFMHPRVVIAWATYATLPSSSNTPLSYSTVYADVPGHTTTNAAAAAQQLQHHFGTASIETSQQALEKEQTEVQNVHYFLQMIALLALLIGGVGIANTMQVLMVRRRTEIAMLKTVGYVPRNLLALFGLEAGLLGLIGGGIGTIAGVGVAFGVKVVLVERVLYLTLPSLVDPLTVGSGIIVGVATALFFGLIPILQASQVRPQAVLRELPGQRGIQSRATVALLTLFLIVVFTGLALSILQDLSVTILVVGATGVLLLFLGGIFSSIAWSISKWPVLEAFRWWYGLLILPLLAVTLAMYNLSPTFGTIFLAITLLCSAMVLLPRPIKAIIKMALRNIERQRIRTVTTLVAIFIGVFATGLVLIGGQNVQGEFTRSLAGMNNVNVLVLSSSAQKPVVEQHIQQLASVSRKDVNTLSNNTTPLAINGTAFAQMVQDAIAQGYTTKQIVNLVGGVDGYDLQHNQQFNADDITLKQGHLLTRNDAGTAHVLLPTAATQAPLHLKLGDHRSAVRLSQSLSRS